MTIFNKNEINSIEEAKEYQNYFGGPLQPEEKSIFDSFLLKPNGTLDKALLQNTAELLNHWKVGKDKVKTETMGLTTEGSTLLKSLLVAQKGNSIPYQIVNNLNHNQPVDKLVDQFEDILFAEFEPEFLQQEQEAVIKISELKSQVAKKDEEIDKLNKENNHQKLLAEQTKLETAVTALVDVLKNDLRTEGVGGRKFFEAQAEINELFGNELYKSDTPAIDGETYGSIIETGIKTPYSNRPYTHPIYLLEDLPSQIWEILKDLDKDKLFAYISSSDCSWTNDQKEKFKKVFSRVVGLEIEIWNPRNKNVMATFNNKSYKHEDTETHRYVSDIFYVMHCLFPQNKPSEWKDSPFLKKGQKSCLPFTDINKNIDTPYPVWWRGADASIRGKRYTDTSPSILRAPFLGEEKHLTWANAQIPEFFWQVYNNPEATDFSAYHKVLGPDLTMVKIREEEITVYEKKIHGWELTKWAFGSDHLDIMYGKYVENLLKNTTDASGNPLVSADEIDKLRSEWGGIAAKIFSAFRSDTFATFSHRAKTISYDKIKEQIAVFDKNTSQLIKAYKGEVDSVTEDGVINKWDEWLEITAAKRKALEKNKADFEVELGGKYIELGEINAQLTKARTDFENAQKLTNTAKQGRVQGLKDTFNLINAKSKKSYSERMFLWSILGLVKNWQNKYPELYPADSSFNVTAKTQELDAEEQKLHAVLTPYAVWEKLGNNFTERLEEWKKTDGLYHSEEVERTHLTKIRNALDSASYGLTPAAENELTQIDHYLKHGPVPMERRILPMELKAALGVKTNVFRDLTHKWIDYSQNIDFKIKANEIEQLANRVNKPGSKIEAPVIKYCKEVLAKKPELIEDDTYDLPAANASNREWLDWFFTRDPEVVVGTIALHELKVDNNLKERILQEMKDYKNSKDNLILLDRTIYGNGENFTEEGIIKYYSEKLGGQNHATRKYEQPFQDSEPTLSFWRWSNPGAYLSVLGLLALGGGLVWAWLRRKKLVAWWNQPIEAQGEEFDEEDEW